MSETLERPGLAELQVMTFDTLDAALVFLIDYDPNCRNGALHDGTPYSYSIVSGSGALTYASGGRIHLSNLGIAVVGLGRSDVTLDEASYFVGSGGKDLRDIRRVA